MPPASAPCGGGGPARDRGRTSAALSVSGIAEPVSRGHSALYHTVLYQCHTVASELCWAVGSTAVASKASADDQCGYRGARQRSSINVKDCCMQALICLPLMMKGQASGSCLLSHPVSPGYLKGGGGTVRRAGALTPSSTRSPGQGRRAASTARSSRSGCAGTVQVHANDLPPRPLAPPSGGRGCGAPQLVSVPLFRAPAAVVAVVVPPVPLASDPTRLPLVYSPRLARD